MGKILLQGDEKFHAVKAFHDLFAGQLTGQDTDNTAAPTIALVAHYDAGGAAPSLATGGDSNASGVALLLELARLFSMSYSSTR